ncbi:MAG: hypothetical protein COB12_06410 [Flavobacterium sp.]|nr:MAG: hypothetical protein COB12_06410 [Flavobacterium sp.]
MLKYIFLSLFFVSSFMVGQRNTDPTPDDISLATELKTTYKNNNIVILNSYENISFLKNEEINGIAVTHKINEELMNIVHRSDIQKYVFYDKESKVKYLKIKYRNKKDAFSRVIDEAVTDDDMFHHDLRVKYMNLDFPVKGYRYFFESKKETFDIKYFTSIYFTNAYPIKYKKIKIIIPEWLNIELKEMNFEGFDIIKSESIDKKSMSKIVTYEINNLIGQYDETQSPGPSFIYPHLLVLAKSFENNKKTNIIFNDTKDLYSWYKSLIDTMDEHPEKLKNKIEKLTKDKITDEEKIKSIFYWVQDNIRYIAFEDGIAGFKPDESQNVFKKRYGDCKGMANLTKQMLQEAGYDARLTWIGTKRIAYDYSTPSLAVDNHMICTVFINDEKIYLDGTEKYNSYGEYAERIQGKQVLIENGNDFILERIPVSTPIKNKETYILNAKIIDEKIVGEVVETYDGESRTAFISYFNSLKIDNKDDAIKSFIDEGNKNIQVSNIETSDFENRDGTLILNYHINRKNAVSSFDEEIYIDLDLKKEFDKFLFKDRHTDYLFFYKKHKTSIINLEIPEGYKIQKTPEAIHIDSKNFKIDISFTQNGSILTYSKTFIIKNAILEKVDFLLWNDIISQVKAIYNEQLILTK